MQRVTKQRKAIQECLERFNTFLSIQEIHAELAKTNQNVGLSTVYRVIGEMHESAEVDLVQSNSGEALYRLCSVNHHHHLVCTECGKAVEVIDDELEAWARKVAKENKFKLSNHFVELNGVCADCA